MLRKMSFAVLCAAAAISTNTHAMPSHSLQTGVTIEYELPPNEPQLFVNYMFWAVEANCKMKTPDDGNELFAEGVLKKGKINGVSLAAGQTLSLVINNNVNLKLSAESGAKVKITNLGRHTVKAICTA